MNVFVDFHHAALLNSLILLFEKRLGGQVYRPIGMEWAEDGYWKVYDHPATRLQYLTLDQGFRPKDGSDPVNQILARDNEVYLCRDIDSNKWNKAITFSAFQRMHFDIVIASLPNHIEPFRELVDKFQPHAKLLFQIGNAWNIDGYEHLIDGVLASANTAPSSKVPIIEYHQEFDLNTFYKGAADTQYPPQRIYSFVNCFSLQDHFRKDWEQFERIEQALPDWEFKAYGGGCRDGAAHGANQVADFMRNSRFIWHVKNGGDGYGHVAFTSAAVGRPMITKMEYYRGKLAEKLMKDGETCIAIDGLSDEQIVNKIEYYNDPFRYMDLCNRVYKNFKESVNFEVEGERIKNFLNNLGRG